MSNSNSSREYSPDWLRNVQAPPIFSLSSSSSSSDEDEDEDDKLPISSVISVAVAVAASGSNVVDSKKKLSNNNKEPHHDDEDDKGPPKSNNNTTLPTQTNQQDNHDHLQTTTDKQTGPYISSSTLPLLLSDKIQRSKVLVECEGESIDLSGDLGSVGRVVIPSPNQDMLLDLKGTIYKTTIIPSRTFCVVSFGQSEAKIEAIMNDFIQLKPQSNVYEAETMVEGTLEGFSFDSEDEGDKHTIRQTDENEGADPQTNRKGRGKSEKTSDAAKKKGKTAVKKPAAAAKKVKKKAPAAKKAKTKK